MSGAACNIADKGIQITVLDKSLRDIHIWNKKLYKFIDKIFGKKPILYKYIYTNRNE